MKKFLVVATALSGLLAFAGSASAADPVVDQTYDWTGFYLGVHGGYGEADVNGAYSGTGDFMIDNGGSFNLDLNGFVGGAQAGVNWQTGNFVFGLEGDITFVDWSDSLTNSGDEERVSAETDFIGTLRARAGYAMDNLLVFATAGAALSDTEYAARDHIGDTDPDENGSLDFNDIGLVVGGGVEYALNQSWSIKAEGLYFIFNDSKDGSTVTHDSASTDDVELDDAWMVRAGVNFHF